MKFTFTEKRMDSSDELRAYTEKKVGKLDRFFKTESTAYVTFSMERGRFLAEITISNNSQLNNLNTSFLKTGFKTRQYLSLTYNISLKTTPKSAKMSL